MTESRWNNGCRLCSDIRQDILDIFYYESDSEYDILGFDLNDDSACEQPVVWKLYFNFTETESETDESSE